MGGVIAYLLFFIAGVGFGYAADGRWRWLPILFPLVLGLFALWKYGPDASVLIRLIVALVITALGVLLGAAIGTFSGRKVVQYVHGHPDNRIDRFLLRTTVTPDGHGGAVVSHSIPLP